MQISLILPCYNPQADWDATLCQQYALLTKEIEQETEVILVLDGMAKEHTESAVSKLRKSIPQLKTIQYDTNRGKGYAVRKGVAAATGDIIMYTDVDFPYTTDSIVTLYKELAHTRTDIAFGIKDNAYYRHVPVARRVISKALRTLTGVLLSMPETDTQCGLKGFRKEVKPLFLATSIDRYLFDLEFLYMGYQTKQLKIAAIPVTLRENITFRKMNYGILIPEMMNFAKLVLRRNK